MNSRWAACVSLDEAEVLLALWNFPAVEVLRCEDKWWARGPLEQSSLRESSAPNRVAPPPVDPFARVRRALPGQAVFRVDPRERLFPPGARLPSGTLPREGWAPLRSCFALRLPWANVPAGGKGETPRDRPSSPRAASGRDEDHAAHGSRTSLVLRRSSVEAPPRLLSLAYDELRRYAETAPAWRLEGLAFAATRDGQCLVRGEPLPALPGIWWTEQQGICVPCGWQWRPCLEPSVIRRAFQLSDDAWAFLAPRGTRGTMVGAWNEEEATEQPPDDSSAMGPDTALVWWRVADRDWVRATRASIRVTGEAWRDASTQSLR